MEVSMSIYWISAISILTCSNLDFIYRRRKIAGQKPPRAKPSPAIIPPTTDAPVHPSGPSTSAQKASKMADSSAKDAMPTANPGKGPKKVTFGGKEVEMAAGASDAAKWKKKVIRLKCIYNF
jgi:hypothetical protein